MQRIQSEYCNELESSIPIIAAASGIASTAGAMTGLYLTKDNPQLSFMAGGVGTIVPLIALVALTQIWIRGIKNG